MSYDLATAITNLQTMIKSISAEIKAAPDEPPESINQFPFSLVVIREFETVGGSYGWDEIIDTLGIEIHLSRVNLPTVYAAALPYRTQILKKLIEDPTIDGSVNTWVNFRGTFGFLSYGGTRDAHIGWSIEIDVKGKVEL